LHLAPHRATAELAPTGRESGPLPGRERHLEVSRLARNCSDWHRLLEICALTDTLILDEDGLYDPSHFNDRLLLGLKGSFSEAELHVLKARLLGGIRKGELVWGPLVYSRALQMLHNPRYAGAFVHGRQRACKTKGGRKGARKVPQEAWDVVIPGAHPGYITWEQYQRHQQRLRECAQAHGVDRRKSPPGEGPALLQGLVVCRVCG